LAFTWFCVDFGGGCVNVSVAGHNDMEAALALSLGFFLHFEKATLNVRLRARGIIHHCLFSVNEDVDYNIRAPVEWFNV
jgi:hypothetical protein